MMLNGFTVDLEDWFQGLTSTNPHPEAWDTHEARLVGNTHRLLELLARHGVEATFFVLGHVADQYPDLIRRIDAAGHEIGVHGYWHNSVHRLTPDRFAVELDRASEALRSLVDQPVIGHRAPYFSINKHALWALQVLREKGFKYDSSFFPSRSLLYGYPEAPRFPCRLLDASAEGPQRMGGEDLSSRLVEFPVSTARWLGVNWPVGGGFYVRALPYAIIRAGIQQIHRQGQPAVLYMHPWELDTEQRYNKVTPRERVSHYYGRRSLRRKLDRLFQDFNFVSLRRLLDQVPP
jgi:polysaccharide deacetylase family protein (PEP-CTERM system associated)